MNREALAITSLLSQLFFLISVSTSVVWIITKIIPNNQVGIVHCEKN